jgi:transglutaminase-like putative cysteine protease
MKQLVLRLGLKSKQLNKIAQRVFIASTDVPNLISNVDRMLRIGYQYVPEKIETIQSPDYMADMFARYGRFLGDCDDASIMVSALLSLLEVPNRFVAIQGERDSNEYDHVYVEAYNGSSWVPIDLTVDPDTKHVYYKRLEVPVYV